MNLKERIYKAIGALARPQFAIPLFGALALGLSFLLEIGGLRRYLALGPERFSYLTVAVGALFILAAALTFVYARGERFDPKSKKQLALFALVLIACALICTASLKNAGEPIKYPMSESELSLETPFVKQFDAFRKGSCISIFG